MLEKDAEASNAPFDPQQAAYKRIQSDEWVDNALNDLCAAIGELYTTVTSHPVPSSATRSPSSVIGPVLVHCDNISLAAQIAAAHAAVCAAECQDWGQGLQDLEAEIDREQTLVGQLRNKLEREKKLAERRAQYEAVASVILKEPGVQESEKELNDAKAALEKVESNIMDIEKVKDGMSKELRLFWHCTSALDAFANNIRALQVGEEQEEGEAMDIST